MPAPVLDVYSDVICPWCYIGKRNMQLALVQLAASGLAFRVNWRPFQLNPDMPAAGVPRVEYRRAKFGSLERAAALDEQVQAASLAAGLPIRVDRIERTPNTLAAHRLIAWAGERGRQDEVVDALFSAYFVEGRDVGDVATLTALADEAGLDAAEATAFLATDRFEREIVAEDRAVREAGLTGIPTFVLERHILFSGAVPPDVFAEALGKAHRVLVPLS